MKTDEHTEGYMTADPAEAAPAVAELLARAQRVLLLTHHNPDGDAIGSLLAMWHLLRDQGKVAYALLSSEPPGFTHILPGYKQLHIYENGTDLPETDLICMVDCANLERVGPVYDDHASTLAAQPLLIIDHHVTNKGEGIVNLVSPGASSCADLIARLFQALAVPITPAIATCLLLGILSDTQSFQTSNTNPGALRAAADLIEAGGDQQAIIREMLFSVPYNTIQLIGLALNNLRREGEIVWLSVPLAMMQQTEAETDAYDQLLSLIQRIAGTRICVLFKERSANEVKISLRSVPPIDVSAIAGTWGGGGHKQAAGATLKMSLEQAEREVLSHIRQHHI